MVFNGFLELPDDTVGVVLPKNKEDIIESIRIARNYNCPVLSRGGGTSLAGQCCNNALIMDMSKYYHGTLEIDAVKKIGRVLPGTVFDDFRMKAGHYGLTFGPDPSTHDHCTVGGMLGNNSCGVHSVMAAKQGTGGRVSDNTFEMEILTYDGLILKGHFGQGCVHCRINFDLVTEEGIKKWRNFLNEATDLVVSYGGSISGEHGDGQSKAELLEKMYGPELIEAFREFKNIWDPENKMNPGKIVDPLPIQVAVVKPPKGNEET